MNPDLIASAGLHMRHIVNGWDPGLVLIGWSSGWPNVMLMLVMVVLGFGFLSVVDQETSFNLLPLHMPGGSLRNHLSLVWIHPFRHYEVLGMHWCRILLWRLELLSEHFDSKKSRECRDSVASPLSCYPEPKFRHLPLGLMRWKELYWIQICMVGVDPLFFSFVLCWVGWCSCS